ncbi:TRAP C4-dicarboxylate transport system permease DctM subunit [Moorella glycerini]|uniref:DctM-like transporter n=1 Tax=Neomoorella stamsii TaxID=1266720 RepID=A0A9X7P701_9FIRM|nr:MULTISPECIES: TRAP transporter fused permease subunit [Moorella]PRR75635.1 DctM-like transporter [Moorella stamsii]CEP66491.1 TRAP C4-dicarboxylate transport system permease DctM subunit [Moorella glycerini]
MASIIEKPDYKRFLALPSLIALAWTLFQLYIVIFGSLHAQVQRPIHVAFAIALVLVSKPLIKGQKGYKWYDVVGAVITFACVFYLMANYERITTRIPMVDPLYPLDIIVGLAFIILLFEAARRATNLALPLIALVFVLYGFFGQHLPGLFGHQGISLQDFIENQFFSTVGVFGSPVAVSVNMVFYFLLFSAFLEATPAGKLFIDLASVSTSKSRGGTGKATIIASGLFGMISGSAAANTVSVGTFTYPLMIKNGFKPKFSASVLAIGGTGGQLIPPIMGAAAFIMVDMIGVSYAEIMKTAIIPSIIYIAALYFVVHYESLRANIKTIAVDITEAKRSIATRIHLLGSIIVLVTLIILGRSLMFSAFWGTVTLLILCFLRKDTHASLYKIIGALEVTARTAVTIAIPCAIAGIIVGVITTSGLGLRFSSLVAQLSQGNLLIALFLTMVMAIILGMGMPTSAAYIMAAVLLAPAIEKLGVAPIVTHFFIFYFANLSMITPPVALASYAAAGLANLDLWEVGLEAFKLSFVIFLLPFAFVFNPGLLGIGNLPEILWVTFTTLVGTWSMSMAVIGYSSTPLNKWQRLLLICAAMLLIVPEVMTDIVGLVIFVAVILPKMVAGRRVAKTF